MMMIRKSFVSDTKKKNKHKTKGKKEEMIWKTKHDTFSTARLGKPTNWDETNKFDFEFEFYCPLLFLSAGTGKKLKQPKRKQNTENKRETKMRPNMIK